VSGPHISRRVRFSVPTWRIDLMPALCQAVLDAPRPDPPSAPPPPRQTWFFCCVCGLWRLVGVSNRGRRWVCSHVCRARLQALRNAEARGPCCMHAINGCPGFRRMRWISCSATCAVAYRNYCKRERHRHRWVERPCVVCDGLIRRRCAVSQLPITCSPPCRGEWRRWVWLELSVADVRKKLATLSPLEAFRFGIDVTRQRVKQQRRRVDRQAWDDTRRAAANAHAADLRRSRLARAAGVDDHAARARAPRVQWAADPVAARHRLDRARADADAAVARAAGGAAGVSGDDAGDAPA
jgi:hypothetical protein